MSKKNNGLFEVMIEAAKIQGVKMTESKGCPQSLVEEEEIIELTDVVDEPTKEEKIVGTAAKMPETEKLMLMTDDVLPDLDMDRASQDLVNSLGMEIETEGQAPTTPKADLAEPVQAAMTPAFVPIDPTQVDAALESIITRMAAERIDQILVDVIEKAVEREIEKIKSVLLEQGSPDET
jgi:hypothetical protein